MVHREIFDFSADGFKEIFFCEKCDAPTAVGVGSEESLCDQCIKEERHNVSVHVEKIDKYNFKYIYNMNERNPQMAAIAYFSGFMFSCRKMGMKLWDIMRWASKLSFSMPEMSAELEEDHEPLFNRLPC